MNPKSGNNHKNKKHLQFLQIFNHETKNIKNNRRKGEEMREVHSAIIRYYDLRDEVYETIMNDIQGLIKEQSI